MYIAQVKKIQLILFKEPVRCRIPLDELEESSIKMVKNKESAGVSNNLKDATKKGKTMIFLKERILQGDWKMHKTNSLINQFY